MNTLTPLLADLGTAQAIFLVGLALLIVVLLIRSRRYFRQVTQYQVPRPDTGVSPTARLAQQATMPSRDFEKWEVAMHDLARDLSGQLDSKIRVLELLIRESEKAAARLEAAISRSRNGADRTSPEPMRESVPSSAVSSNGEKTVKKIMDRLSAAAPNASPLKSVSLSASATTTAIPSATAAPRPSAADKPRFDRIYALADAGLSPAKIANQIGSQIGEVELILGIRGRNDGPGARG